MSSSLLGSALSRLRCAVRYCSPVNAHPVLAGRPVFPTERAFRSEAGGGADPPVSLEQCYNMLTSAKCDWQQLQNLPQATLLSLLKRCAQESNELKASKELLKEQGKRLQGEAKWRYYVDPGFVSRRVDLPKGPLPSDPVEEEAAYQQRTEEMERLLEDVRSKWQTQPVEGLSPEDEQLPRGYPMHLRWSMQQRRFTLADQLFMVPPELAFPRVISSALLLYRACCLFEAVDVNTSDLTDRYKCVWVVRLWHTATGRELYLSESKGAASVYMQWPSVEDKQLSSDFLQLMNLLCGECPHTYNWTLAGSVA